MPPKWQEILMHWKASPRRNARIQIRLIIYLFPTTKIPKQRETTMNRYDSQTNSFIKYEFTGHDEITDWKCTCQRKLSYEKSLEPIISISFQGKLPSNAPFRIPQKSGKPSETATRTHRGAGSWACQRVETKSTKGLENKVSPLYYAIFNKHIHFTLKFQF